MRSILLSLCVSILSLGALVVLSSPAGAEVVPQTSSADPCSTATNAGIATTTCIDVAEEEIAFSGRLNSEASFSGHIELTKKGSEFYDTPEATYGYWVYNAQGAFSNQTTFCALLWRHVSGSDWELMSEACQTLAFVPSPGTGSVSGHGVRASTIEQRFGSRSCKDVALSAAPWPVVAHVTRVTQSRGPVAYVTRVTQQRGPVVVHVTRVTCVEVEN
jgi:hypothetical protein